MIDYRSHSSGMMLIEVIIALLMIAITITALLSSQGRAFDAGTRALTEQHIILALKQEFMRLDLKGDLQRKPFTKPLPDDCPPGTITFTLHRAPKESSLAAYQNLHIEVLTATWHSGRNEEKMRLVRYRYQLSPEKSADGTAQETHQRKELK